MGNAANLAQEVLLAIDRDRQSFVSLAVRRLLIEAAREGLSDPHAEQARKLIDAERSKQDAKWGQQNHDPQVWMAILGEEYGELCQAANDLRWPKSEMDADPFRHALVEAVQTAAVAQAVVECLLRSTWKWPRKPSAHDPAKRYMVADDSRVTRRYVQFPYLPTALGNVLALSETVTEDTLTGSGDECEAFVSLLKGNNTHTCLKVVEVPND